MKFQLLHDYVHELRLVGVLRWWKPQCKRGKDAFGYALVTWNSTTSCVSPTSFSAAYLLATWQFPDLSSLCSLKVGSLARCACRCVCGYGSYQSLPRISFFLQKHSQSQLDTQVPVFAHALPGLFSLQSVPSSAACRLRPTSLWLEPQKICRWSGRCRVLDGWDHGKTKHGEVK